MSPLGLKTHYGPRPHPSRVLTLRAPQDMPQEPTAFTNTAPCGPHQSPCCALSTGAWGLCPCSFLCPSRLPPRLVLMQTSPGQRRHPSCLIYTRTQLTPVFPTPSPHRISPLDLFCSLLIPHSPTHHLLSSLPCVSPAGT